MRDLDRGLIRRMPRLLEHTVETLVGHYEDLNDHDERASVDNYVWPISLLLVFSLVHVFDRLALIRLISRRVKSAVLIPVSVMALTMGYVLGAQDQQHYIYFDF